MSSNSVCPWKGSKEKVPFGVRSGAAEDGHYAAIIARLRYPENNGARQVPSPAAREKEVAAHPHGVTNTVGRTCSMRRSAVGPETPLSLPALAAGRAFPSPPPFLLVSFRRRDKYGTILSPEEACDHRSRVRKTRRW
ncbi:hypothetical protein HPB48_007069 [Haemaphysalis longicornis]|uniref:Uncharacterized protein n=1 Tax=Haemaphysalis longicornis TaxID=44386 RepID=A0A9J6G2A5_HAELO|nr:hypothetical protein HPB48_007069 [Haemaphysalis longicornis]